MERNSENWITTEEAAEYLRITSRAVRDNARNGKYGEIKEAPSRGGRSGISYLIRPENLPAEAYVRYYAAKNQPPQIDNLGPEWEQATQRQKEKAVAIHQRLMAWRQFREHNPGNKGDIDDRFLAAWRQLHPEDRVSLPTLYRDWDKFTEGGLAALVPQQGLHRRGAELISPEAKATFITLWGKLVNPSIAHCVEQLRTINIIDNKGWTLPHSNRTFERIIVSLDDATKTLMREGETALNNKHGAHLIRDYDGLEVMQIWQCDHQEQDFFVQGPHGEIARPWQTVWMDARSRMVVGWHCSMSGNTDTIMAAFVDGSLALGGALGGLVPPHWVIDNGRDFTGKRLTNGCKKFRKINESTVKSMTQHLGITVHYCIPENPQAKHIERCFNTLREYFDKYQPTYTGNRPEKRTQEAEDARKAGKVMTWAEYVQASKDAWLYYNTRPHSGAGMDGKCPKQVFYEGLEKIQVRRVKPEALMFLMWRTSDPRLVRGGGVQIDGRFYRSTALLEYEGKKVHARYSPNWETVYIFSQDDVKLCEAKLVQNAEWLNQEKTAEGMAQKNAAKKQTRQKVDAIRKAADPVALDDAKLFTYQTEMAGRIDVAIPKTSPKVVEPVRTPFDQIAGELVETAGSKRDTAKSRTQTRPEPEIDALALLRQAMNS
jgi:putative transposase